MGRLESDERPAQLGQVARHWCPSSVILPPRTHPKTSSPPRTPLLPFFPSRLLIHHMPRHLFLLGKVHVQVMRNFSVDALYVFHEAIPVHASQERFRRASKTGRRAGNGSGGDDGNGGTESQRKSGGGNGDVEGVGLRRVHRPPVNRLRLDVPELSSELDSRQVRFNVVLHASLGFQKRTVYE